MKKRWIFVIVLVVVSITWFQSVNAQTLSMVTEGFLTDANRYIYPQAIRVRLNASGLDSIGVTISNENAPYGIFYATVYNAIPRIAYETVTHPDSAQPFLANVAYYDEVTRTGIAGYYSRFTRPDSLGGRTIDIYPYGTQQFDTASSALLADGIEVFSLKAVGYKNGAAAITNEWDFAIDWSPNGNQLLYARSVAQLSSQAFKIMSGKITNDAYSDIVLHEIGMGNWYLGERDPLVNAFNKRTTPFLTGFGMANTYTSLLGNVVGSSLDDFILLDRSLGRWFVARNYGDHAEIVIGPGPNGSFLDNWGKSSVGSYTPLLGDLNNDGWMDIILFEAISGNWYGALCDPNSLRFIPLAAPLITGFGNGVGLYIPLTGNFVGDGKYDIALYHKSSGNWYVAENTNGIQCTRRGTWLTGFGDGVGYVPITNQFYGSVYTDVLLQDQGTGNFFLIQSTGSAFQRVTGPYIYGSVITGYGNGTNSIPLSGNFTDDGYADLSIYQNGIGTLHVAKNEPGINRFLRTTGSFTSAAWVEKWGITTNASAKLVDEEVVTEQVLPQSVTLAQNYPNPFNPVTTIEYSLDAPLHVRLDIINILGQTVTTLVDEDQPAGSYSVEWHGGRYASGMYFYRLSAGDIRETRKMILLK